MLPMLVPMLTNVIGGLCADAATNLAKDHVMDMVNKVVPPEAMAVIDQVVSADPSQPCGSMMEMVERIADPLDESMPSMPQMPSMDDMMSHGSAMMGAALGDETMNWANDMMHAACTYIDDTASAGIAPVSFTYNVTFDPATMDLSIERA